MVLAPGGVRQYLFLCEIGGEQKVEEEDLLFSIHVFILFLSLRPARTWHWQGSPVSLISCTWDRQQHWGDKDRIEGDRQKYPKAEQTWGVGSSGATGFQL